MHFTISQCNYHHRHFLFLPVGAALGQPPPAQQACTTSCANASRGLITLHGCNSSLLIPSALGKRPVLLDKLIRASCVLQDSPELFPVCVGGAELLQLGARVPAPGRPTRGSGPAGFPSDPGALRSGVSLSAASHSTSVPPAKYRSFSSVNGRSQWDFWSRRLLPPGTGQGSGQALAQAVHVPLGV